MSDLAAAWLASMIRHGETAIVLRQAGHTWHEIAEALHLGDVPTVQRAAALFLASDYESRRTAGEAAGKAQPLACGNASPGAKGATLTLG